MGQHETFQKAVSNGDFSFTARHDGKYLYCFGNEHWGSNSKEVSFNVHGIVYVSEGDAPQDPLEKESKCCAVAYFLTFNKYGLDQFTNGAIVKQLSELVEQARDEQSYIVVRERTHRNTAESTNSRVKWWNLFVIGVVVGESLFQVWWLRRFFEVKRVV